MNPQTLNPNGINEVQASQSGPAPGARCHRRTRHGHQCRLRPLGPGGLCFRHASLQSQVKQPVDVDLITNQLLRTVSIMNKESNDPPQIICDMPGPEPDTSPLPEPTYADLRT